MIGGVLTVEGRTKLEVQGPSRCGYSYNRPGAVV